MHFQYVPYVWVLVAAAAITAALGLYAWRHRRVPGALPFAGLMGLTTVWALANGLEIAGTDLPTKLFWANLQYLCYAVIAPLVWLALTLHYLDRVAWLTRRRLVGVCLVPALTIGLVWTNDLHHLVWSRVALDVNGPWPIVIKTLGPWFRLQCPYSYLMLFIACAVLLRALRRLSAPYRGQILVLMFGLLIPMVSVALHNVGLDLIPRYDLSPALMSVSGVIVAWGLFYYRLFDLAPVARATVIDGMDDGVIVLDAQQRVVDVNAAARQLVGEPLHNVIGRPAAEVFQRWPDLIELCQAATLTQTEITLEHEGLPQFFDLRISPLSDRRHRPIGRVITLRDVTARVRTAALLLHQQQALAVMHDRERLARDLHDGLAQDLAGLRLRLSVWHKLAETDPPRLHTELDSVRELLGASINEVRRTIYALRPLPLDELGFFPALRQFAHDFGGQTGLHIEVCTVGPPERLPALLELIVFRMIQEALSNISKHAQAREAHIELDLQTPDQLRLTIRDDGHGFDPATLDEAVARGHLGLAHLRQRVQDLHGQLTLTSAAGSRY